MELQEELEQYLNKILSIPQFCKLVCLKTFLSEGNIDSTAGALRATEGESYP